MSKRTEEDIETLGQQLALMASRVHAIMLLLNILLADRLERADDPIRASERLIENAIRTFGADSAFAIRVTEEIASVVHEAARIASARKENRK